MKSQDVEYIADGQRCVGYLAVADTSSPRVPGVLIAHEGPGLDDHAKRTADRLAAMGCVAFALDYHGNGERLPDAAVMPRLSALIGDSDRIRTLGRAGLAVLAAQDHVDPNRIAAIGYCFGGTLVLELARGGAELRAVVGFHSGLATTRPQDAAHIRAKVLVSIGAEDPLVPSSQREEFEAEMRAANVDWQLHLYGQAAHSFTNPAANNPEAGIAYNQQADERSWRSMLELFEETIDLRAPTQA